MDIYELEALANRVCEETQTAAEKLARMIRAYARIIYAKNPGKFKRRAAAWADEDGHWDNSYPPKIEYKERTGPLSITIIDSDRDSKATSDGFYHDIEYFTTDPGLYVCPDGSFIGATLKGTGSFGQFAAHPGEFNVQCVIEYTEIDLGDIPLDRLAKAEKELRALAFPLVAKRVEVRQ
jgi:hypothetical protein